MLLFFVQSEAPMLVTIRSFVFCFLYLFVKFLNFSSSLTTAKFNTKKFSVLPTLYAYMDVLFDWRLVALNLLIYTCTFATVHLSIFKLEIRQPNGLYVSTYILTTVIVESVCVRLLYSCIVTMYNKISRVYW